MHGKGQIDESVYWAQLTNVVQIHQVCICVKMSSLKGGREGKGSTFHRPLECINMQHVLYMDQRVALGLIEHCSYDVKQDASVYIYICTYVHSK